MPSPESDLPACDCKPTMDGRTIHECQPSFDTRFPGQRDVIGTHYDDCYRAHTACAYLLGEADAAARLNRYEQALSYIAGVNPECRPDGTYNVDRIALIDIAREALK